MIAGESFRVRKSLMQMRIERSNPVADIPEGYLPVRR